MLRSTARTAVLGAALVLLRAGGHGAESAEGRATPCSAAAKLRLADLGPSMYYAIDLIPTRRVPGTGAAGGVGRVTFARSPFGVSISPKGTYVYDLSLSLERIKPPSKGVYTGWVTTPTLDQVKRLGVFDDAFRLSGRVDWNKFLVVVTLEPTETPGPGGAADTWVGPIVMRGMSRSGMMHTLAGHGPFEREPCSKYGF